VAREGDYFGTVVNRTARLMAIGHGGQVLCSSTTAELVGDTQLGLTDLGEHRLRDLDRPMHVFQVGGGSFPRLSERPQTCWSAAVRLGGMLLGVV
jgi:class 3 adenylate cyclase